MTTMVYKPGNTAVVEGVGVDFMIVEDVDEALKDGWSKTVTACASKGKSKKKASE